MRAISRAASPQPVDGLADAMGYAAELAMAVKPDVRVGGDDGASQPGCVPWTKVSLVMP